MNFALIGSNFIVDWFMDALRLTPGANAYMTYSRTQAQAEINAQKWGAQRAVSSMEELLNDPAVEAVYIASPNRFHYDQAMACLKAGKHVLVEKPACLCEKQFAELMQAARENSVIIMEAIRPVHLPFIGQIRSLMEELGPIRHAEFPYCQYSSRYDRFKRGELTNTFDPTMGGGALMDIGVYCLSWMELLLGSPKKLFAVTTFVPGAIDGCTDLLCAYDGLNAAVSSSKIHDAFRPITLEGEKGSIAMFPPQIPEKITIQRKGEQPVEIIPEREEKDMVYELRDFLACCAGEQDVTPWQEHTLAVLRMLDEARLQTGIDFTTNQSQN